MDRKKITFPLKYLARGEKSFWKYSARGSKSQPIFCHSADLGKIPSKFLPQGKFIIIYKLKETHIPPFNQ